MTSRVLSFSASLPMVFAGVSISPWMLFNCAALLYKQPSCGRTTKMQFRLAALRVFWNVCAHYVRTIPWCNYAWKGNSRAVNTINWTSSIYGNMQRSIVLHWQSTKAPFHSYLNKKILLMFPGSQVHLGWTSASLPVKNCLPLQTNGSLPLLTSKIG